MKHSLVAGRSFQAGSGEEESGGSGVWIQPATRDTASVRLADGVVASRSLT